MLNLISVARGTFTNETVVTVTPGIPYVLFLDGTYTNVTVSADIVVEGTTRNMPVTTALVQTDVSRVIYAPTSKLKLTATGASNSVFYYLRATVQPTATVGSSSYV